MAGFFDDMRDALSKGIGGVSDKYKDITSSAELRGTIRPLMAEIDEQLKKIGELIYESQTVTSIPPSEKEIERLCGKIAVLKEMVDDKMAAHSASTGYSGPGGGGLRCSCGASLKPTSKFCPECGKKPDIDIQAASGKKCPECGATLSENSRFCHGCGKSAAEQQPGNNCPDCGAAMSASAKFCPECGKTC